MLLPYPSSFLPKPLPNPSPQIPLFFSFPPLLPKFQTKFYTFASSSDTKPLPQSPIKRIVEKLRSLGYTDDKDKNDPPVTLNISPGEIFVPLPNQLPKYRVGHSFDPSWSTPENPVPKPGSGNAIRRHNELRREVWKEKVKRRVEGRENAHVPTLGELKVSPEELRRLRGDGIALNKKLKIGKAGITEGIVNGIHERWTSVELVKIKCEDMSRLNMKRTHDLLERKTGGLVIWRSGSIIILYRGADYKYPYFFDDKDRTNDTSDCASLDLHMDRGLPGEKGTHSSSIDNERSSRRIISKPAQPPLIQGVGSPNRVRFQLPGEAQLAEEADHLLEGLGPRFIDWWGYDPLPVDGDLLPAIIPGHRRPFRLLPYGVKPKLTNDEMTTLRRLGRPLPCHFALSRNRKLQGLAASIIKLWEKCEIAKIAVKRGVQNTNSLLMTEELKWLTGGTVLSRDREYIVLYRGKDFLPSAVSSAIEQRRKYGIHGSENRTDSSSSVSNIHDHKHEEIKYASEDKDGEMNDHKHKAVSEQRKLRSREAAITRTSSKLSLTLEKKAKAEKLLEELEKEEIQQPPEIDTEGITEEERHMLRKVGLRMKPFLLLGRRGVFDGTVENMHLHWKYRELVKIICGEKSIEEVQARARTLEAESGGILVAVERVSKGYAIIVYRGKNYQRPASLRPQTLLNKREALKRSIEAQRRESLKLHVLKLSRNVDELKHKLAKDKETIIMQLPKNLRLEGTDKQDLDKKQSPAYERSDTDLETCSDEDEDSNMFNVIQSEPVSELELEKTDLIMGTDDEDGDIESLVTIFPDDYMTKERHGVASTPFNTDNVMKTSSESRETAQRDMIKDFSVKYEEKDVDLFNTIRSEPLSQPALEGSDVVMDMDGEVGDVEPLVTMSEYESRDQTSFSSIGDTEPHICNITSKESSVNSRKSEAEVSVDGTMENGSDGDAIPFRATRLSNKERLLLRKQALQMKKRPVLAVGRSNIVTGVAKTIKTHFQKHPLAIVNVKGRAKGTSVQELVSKLEQATGAVLVSQEPSKVILYRGWGAKEEHGKTHGNTSTGTEGRALPAISPELISAIRLECGLQCNQDDGTIA